MDALYPSRLTSEELAAEAGTLLPPKEVLSLLDLAIDLDLVLDLAAPIDLAVAANANVAAPINASVGANVLSALSNATSVANQGVLIDQVISGEAVANAPQTSVIDQTDTGDGGTDSTADSGGTDDTDITQTDPTDVASALNSGLLNVDANISLDADLAAPIAGAVAANANAAVPINASVAANVVSIGSEAVSVADQQAIITQNLDDVEAVATADQDSTIDQ